MAITKKQVRASLEPDEPDYAAAAEQLGQEALPYLTDLLDDPEPGIAAKAASLAGKIGGADAVVVLQKAAAAADPVVRVAAGGAAAGLSRTHAATVLATLVLDADIGVQKVALNAVPAKPTKALQEAIESLVATDPLILSLRERALGREPAREPAKGGPGAMPELDEMPGEDGMDGAEEMNADTPVDRPMTSESRSSTGGDMPTGSVDGESSPSEMPTGSMH